MPQTIMIDPVTRIEGHAKITVQLDDEGQVADAHFHVTEFRGFERFCEGRTLWEMPGLTARTCGICPVSHLMASAKAGDQILAVNIPPTAEKLRRLVNLAQLVQSHALSFFHLSSPDLLLGMTATPRRATSSASPRPTLSWHAPASACAPSARRSSPWWPGSASTPPGPCPAASARP